MASKKTTTAAEQPEAVTEEVKKVADEIDKDAEIEQLKAQIALLMQKIGADKPTEEVKAPEPTEDEWEEYIEVVVPRHGRGQEKCFYVGVNGRNAQIPADGKRQRIRKPHALALLASLEAEAKAEEFAENLPHEAAPASFAELMGVINDLKSKLRESGISV